MKQNLILSGNCYWCLEAIFQKIKGINNVSSGTYHLEDYDFSFGKNDKVEAIMIEYDSNIISINSILNIFFLAHTPTLVSWNKEDSFYPLCRSAVFYFTYEQKETASEYLQNMIHNKLYDSEIYTKIIPYKENNFFLTDLKNQDYFKKNPNEGYCQSIIVPKIEKLNTQFKNYLK